MDTKYFRRALEEFINLRKMDYPPVTVGELTLSELSYLLRRAQELKEADRIP